MDIPKLDDLIELYKEAQSTGEKSAIENVEASIIAVAGAEGLLIKAYAAESIALVSLKK